MKYLVTIPAELTFEVELVEDENGTQYITREGWYDNRSAVQMRTVVEEKNTGKQPDDTVAEAVLDAIPGKGVLL